MALIRLNNQSLTNVTALAGFTSSSTSGTAINIGSNNHVTMASQPFFSAYKNGDQVLTAHTPTKITSWSTMYDVGSGWDASNNKWVAPTDGYYLIHLCIQSNVLNGLHVRVDVNGSSTWNGNAYLDGNDVSGMNNTYFADLSVNDYVEFYAYLTTNGNVNASRTRASVVKLA